VEGEHPLLDDAVGEEPNEGGRLVLAHAVHAGGGLVLGGPVPPRVEQEPVRYSAPALLLSTGAAASSGVPPAARRRK
jgi:hypothetical protein